MRTCETCLGNQWGDERFFAALAGEIKRKHPDVDPNNTPAVSKAIRRIMRDMLQALIPAGNA